MLCGKTFCHKIFPQILSSKFCQNFVKDFVALTQIWRNLNDDFDEIWTIFLTNLFVAKCCGKTFCHKVKFRQNPRFCRNFALWQNVLPQHFATKKIVKISVKFRQNHQSNFVKFELKQRNLQRNKNEVFNQTSTYTKSIANHELHLSNIKYVLRSQWVLLFYGYCTHICINPAFTWCFALKTQLFNIFFTCGDSMGWLFHAMELLWFLKIRNSFCLRLCCVCIGRNFWGDFWGWMGCGVPCGRASPVQCWGDYRGPLYHIISYRIISYHIIYHYPHCVYIYMIFHILCCQDQPKVAPKASGAQVSVLAFPMGFSSPLNV